MMAKQAGSTVDSHRQVIGEQQLEELGQYIDAMEDTDGSLIQILHHAQGLYGYLPREVQLFVARRLGIPGAEVYGVVSFYSFFVTKPPGKHTISICMGTACFVRGADKIMRGFEGRLGIGSGGTTGDNLFTLKDVRCVGACGLAPVVLVGDKVYGRVAEEDIDKILAEYREVK